MEEGENCQASLYERLKNDLNILHQNNIFRTPLSMIQEKKGQGNGKAISGAHTQKHKHQSKRTHEFIFSSKTHKKDISQLQLIEEKLKKESSLKDLEVKKQEMSLVLETLEHRLQKYLQNQLENNYISVGNLKTIQLALQKDLKRNNFNFSKKRAFNQKIFHRTQKTDKSQRKHQHSSLDHQQKKVRKICKSQGLEPKTQLASQNRREVRGRELSPDFVMKESASKSRMKYFLDLKLKNFIISLKRLQHNQSLQGKNYDEKGTQTAQPSFKKKVFSQIFKKYIEQNFKQMSSEFSIQDLGSFFRKKNFHFQEFDFESQKLLKIYNDCFQKQIIFDEVRKDLNSQNIYLEDYFQKAFEHIYRKFSSASDQNLETPVFTVSSKNSAFKNRISHKLNDLSPSN